MGLFDLLFIVLFLATLVALCTAALFAIRGKQARALRILARLGYFVAAYLTIVILVSLVTPRRTLKIGDRQCFDDWCVAVEDVSRTPTQDGILYSIALRLSSRARRVAQRENNLSVYMTDDRDRRYEARADPSAIPFNILLKPQQSAAVHREFAIPTDLKPAGLVITHEGGFPIGWFIIGYDTWFRKPPILPL